MEKANNKFVTISILLVTSWIIIEFIF